MPLALCTTAGSAVQSPESGIRTTSSWLGSEPWLTLVGAFVGASAGFYYMYHHLVVVPRQRSEQQRRRDQP